MRLGLTAAQLRQLTQILAERGDKLAAEHPARMHRTELDDGLRSPSQQPTQCQRSACHPGTRQLRCRRTRRAEAWAVRQQQANRRRADIPRRPPLRLLSGPAERQTAAAGHAAWCLPIGA
ncbi:hypothetical protein G6F35_016728 [Rhizopus arrhizus]|nr:hypothetical protein G6F35_016728 [Rhizopus arrhizus]